MKEKFILLSLFFIATCMFSLHAGNVSITWGEIVQTLFFHHSSSTASSILFDLRIPRLLAGLFVGASLGAVGLVFQTLLRNPLAEPYTLGLSGGGALGAVLALSLNLSPSLFWIPLSSSLGCLCATLLVLLLAQRQLELESRSLILFGIMISLFFGAVVVTGMSQLSPQKLQMALFWLLGEFGTLRDRWIYGLSPFFAGGMILLLFKYKALEVLALGEARALSLGFSPKRERNILILICTLLTALGVSIAGLIGFVGLVSPHLARRYFNTAKQTVLLPASMLIGSALLITADAIGRSLGGTSEVPAGSVAALFGAPILIVMLMRQTHAAAD